MCIEELARAGGLGKLRGPQFSMRLPQKPSFREPDVMFVSTENLPRLGRTLLDGPCDLAVEVVTRASVARDFREKYLEYEAAGIREYWIVDPLYRVIDAHQLDASRRYVPIVADASNRLHSSVVLGWWLQPELLFAEPTPTGLDLLRSLAVV